MTPKNFFTRLQTLIKAMVWPTGGAKIFGDNVFVVAKLPGMPIGQIVSPTCYIVENGFAPHDEHPNILFQNFQLVFFVENVQSEFGQASFLGATTTANTSRGIGVLDLEAQVIKQVIEVITLTDKISIKEDGASKCQEVSSNAPNLYRLLNYSTI